MPGIRAKHHRTKPCENGFGMSHKGKLFGNNATIVGWQIGQMQGRAFSANLISNGIEYLALCKRTVIRDVIDIAGSLLMIGRQEETLHYIGNIAKWQGVVSSPNKDAFAIFQALSHTAKVQAISGAEEGAGANDDGLHIACAHEALDQTISLC